jgi:hypothetical protein
MAIQFIGSLRVAEGSKIENRLAIIFILRFQENIFVLHSVGKLRN